MAHKETCGSLFADELAETIQMKKDKYCESEKCKIIWKIYVLPLVTNYL